MIAWTEYIDPIRPFLPECPDVVIEQHVARAATEFCNETMCWVETSSFTVVPSERDIPLASMTVPSTMTIVQPVWIGNDTGTIEPRTLRWLNRMTPTWRYDNGAPKYYTMPTRGTILWLTPHPEESLDLDCEIAVKPSATATEGPDDLFEDYGDEVQAGALSTLLLIPGKPWSNPNLAMAKAAEFSKGKTSAYLRFARGNSAAPVRTRMDYRF